MEPVSLEELEQVAGGHHHALRRLLEIINIDNLNVTVKQTNVNHGGKGVTQNNNLEIKLGRILSAHGL